MSNKLPIFILVLIAGTVAAFAADRPGKAVVQDGFVLAGMDGKLIAADNNDVWLFEFDSDISDGKGRISAGTRVELLPSATLEKLTADARNRSAANYRLWGRITKYKGRNFIFASYFLPLSKVRPKPQQQQQQVDTTINEPNDTLVIPEEIVNKLRTSRIVPAEQLRQSPNATKGAWKSGTALELRQDFILADRTGLIVSRPNREIKPAKRDTRYDSFVLDALGRNVRQASFWLLPCKALEQTMQLQSREPDPLRFKVAGIVTRYKGEHYLLLQRATRVYSHENFGR